MTCKYCCTMYLDPEIHAFKSDFANYNTYSWTLIIAVLAFGLGGLLATVLSED